MSRVPDFGTIHFAPARAALSEVGAVWHTPEGIAVKPIYGPADLAGLDHLDTWPGLPPYLRGPYPDDVRQPAVDGAAICRLLDGRGIQRLLSRQSRRRARRASRSPSISPPIAAMIPIIRASPAMSAWRASRSTSIYDMRTLFSGIPLDAMSVSMTMNGAVLPVLALFIVAAEEQGVADGGAVGHDPERHPQGVHGPQHLHLSARAPRCGSSPTFSPSPRRTCRSSTRSRSPAITCRRPARRRTSSSPTRSPTASNISAPGSPRA